MKASLINNRLLLGRNIFFIFLCFRPDICQHSWCPHPSPGSRAPQLGVEHAGDWQHQEEHQDAAHSQAQGTAGAEL